MSVSGKESRSHFSKLLCKLKMRAMSGIREEYEARVGKLLLKDERIQKEPRWPESCRLSLLPVVH
jgi:hypothetical protein